jgi:hypothetical protein
VLTHTVLPWAVDLVSDEEEYAPVVVLEDTARGQVRYFTQIQAKLWEVQGERNPQSAAHLGQYAYKRATALCALEPGLDAHHDPPGVVGTWLGRFAPRAQAIREASLPHESPHEGTMKKAEWSLLARAPLFIVALLILAFSLVYAARSGF